MPEIAVNLILLDGTPLSNTQLPQEATAQDVVADIVDQLGWPSVDENNQAIEYYLETAQGKRLGQNETLLAAGVEHGATLSLKSTSVVRSALPPPPSPPPPDGTLELNVRLLDINQNVLESFPHDARIEDVLSQIIAKHKLPTRDEKFKQGKIYEIWSKTSGAFLQEKLTLRELMIPNRDTLVIATHETPGARG